MTRKRVVDWVFWRTGDGSRDDGGAYCERCGVEDPRPPMPLPVSAFVKWCEYVLERHRGCEP